MTEVRKYANCDLHVYGIRLGLYSKSCLIFTCAQIYRVATKKGSRYQITKNCIKAYRWD